MTEVAIKWHVLMVEGGRETAVVAELLGRGHDAYAPMETVWADRRHRLRVRGTQARERVRRPLFPSYIFATMEEGQSFALVEAQREVHHFVRFNGRPAAIPSRVVEGLRAAETLGAFDRAPESGRRKSNFQPGQSARIVTGPWSGFVATVTRTAAKDRIRLLLAMLRRAVEVEIAETALAPV